MLKIILSLFSITVQTDNASSIASRQFQKQQQVLIDHKFKQLLALLIRIGDHLVMTTSICILISLAVNTGS